MLNLFKTKPTIEFFTADFGARKYYPVKLAKECIPDYWKKMPSKTTNDSATVRMCPGIGDWLTTGFIITAWCDIEVDQTGPYGPEVSLFNKHESASAHPPYQCLDLLTEKSHHHGTVKLPGTWMIKTSPGWSIMTVPLWYWKNQPWEALPGIVHSDNHHGELNVNFTLKSQEPKFTIAAGTPLVHIIPFKRDPVHGISRAATQEDFKRHRVLLKMYEWYKNGISKFYKQTPKYYLEQQDTDLEESLKFPLN